MVQGRSFRKFLSNVITIWRKEAQQDDFGGVKSAWVRKYWDIKSRIYGNSGGKSGYSITVDGQAYDITHKGLLEKHIDIVSGDKLTDYDSGSSYIVLRVYETKEAKKIHHLEMILSEIQE